jgi:pyridoxine 5-phosphate synthase
MVKLSVNINKIATLRNARGGNTPNVLEAALNCEKFGAQGITVHPRPDERHIRYRDVHELSNKLYTEFNIEGYPTKNFIDLVLKTKPQQVTLVPDPPDALTSNAGWDTLKNASFLTEVLSTFKKANIRTSVFIDCDAAKIEKAAQIGANRVELYTESFATQYDENRTQAIKPFKAAADVAHKNELGLNAGHDLNLNNLQFFCQQIPHLLEVSIGHALISDALYLGLENTIQMYLRKIEMAQP